MISQKTLDSVCSNTARILREERQRMELSMTTVAEGAGLSQQMVSYVERGLRKPNLDTLLRISYALKLDPAEVIRRAQQ